jgi:hypothetical protein
MVPCFLYFSGSFQKLKKENLLKRKSFTHQCGSYNNSSLIIVINFDTRASKIENRTFMCKKEIRTTKMKRRKEHAEIGFQDVGSHFFKSLQSMEILKKPLYKQKPSKNS